MSERGGDPSYVQSLAESAGQSQSQVLKGVNKIIKNGPLREHSTCSINYAGSNIATLIYWGIIGQIEGISGKF